MKQDTKLKMFFSMLRLRLVEETIADRYSEQEMRCPVHLSTGQEAASVGACSALSPDDVIVSTHRSHGHYLAKGGNLNALLGEIHGRSTGCCGGRGGSMHLFDDNAGVLSSLPIVGSSIPIGVGAALTFQQRQSAQVSMVFLGDGATEEGVFHECMNFASVRKLPVVFFVENNFYSVYTNLEDRQPNRPIAAYGDAHAMSNTTIDGNNVLVVFESVRKMVDRARKGAGPGLIVAETYRWREHCGPNFDNDLGYRSVTEYEKWRQLCPIAQFRAHLIEDGILSDDRESQFRSEIETELDAAFENACTAPFPDPKSAMEKVYA